MSGHIYTDKQIYEMSNSTLIDYACYLDLEYKRATISAYQYVYGRVATIHTIRLRIANNQLRWFDCPNYIPYMYGDRAVIATNNAIWPIGSSVTIRLIEHVNLDPMLNIYQASLHDDKYTGNYVYEYQLADRII